MLLLLLRDRAHRVSAWEVSRRLTIGCCDVYLPSMDQAFDLTCPGRDAPLLLLRSSEATCFILDFGSPSPFDIGKHAENTHRLLETL